MKDNIVMNDILNLNFEWVWKGTVRDFHDYVKQPTNYYKLFQKPQAEICGIFINKLKMRLREAFVNINHLGRINGKNFKILLDYDSRILEPYFNITDIKFDCENLTSSDEFAWYIRYTAQYFPISSCIGTRLGTVQDFINATYTKPAIEEIEDDIVILTAEEALNNKLDDDLIGNNVY